MIWLPMVRADVLKLAVAVPPLLLSVPWPTLLPLSRKLTVPVGLPRAPGPLTVTVAVNVIIWPNTDGLPEEVTAVVVAAWLTDCVRFPELAKKLLSPPYVAVMVWLPAVMLEVVKLAVVVPPLVV